MSKKNNCPRGFKWNESKKQCTPDGSEIKDKLTMKYERYFFKENSVVEAQKCKEGYRWCNITNKCVPIDDKKLKGQRLGRGQGGGPMGKPFKEANDLIDLAYNEGFEVFGKAIKAEKKIDTILDSIEEGVGGKVLKAAADTAKGVGSAAKGIAMWTAADMALRGGANAAAKMLKKRKAKQICNQRFQKGTPQFQKCMQRAMQTESEKIDFGKEMISTTGRPYDHPLKMRVTADVDECDMMHRAMMQGHDLGDDDYDEDDRYYGDDGDFDQDDGYDYEDQDEYAEDIDDDSFEGEYDSGPSEDEEDEKISNDINHIPNQNGRALYKSIIKQIGEMQFMTEEEKGEYKEFFDKKLQQFGVSSPKDLDDDEKKKFFDQVDKEWKAQNEGWERKVFK